MVLVIARKSYAQDDTYLDRSFKYNPDVEISLFTRIIESPDNFRVFLRIILPEGSIIDSYTITTGTASDYSQNDIPLDTRLTYEQHGIYTGENTYVLKADVNKSPDNKLLLIRINKNDEKTSYIRTLLLEHASIFPHPDFYLSDYSSEIPVFDSFVSTTDSLIIKDLQNDNSAYYVYYYAKDFETADPPMYLLDKKVSRSLNIDSIFTIQPGQPFSLTSKGFYFIQKDTAGFIGIPTRVQDRHFPRYASIDDLYEPVIYLSTNRETLKLTSSEEKKRAFDEFWIGMSKSPDKAKSIIRNYYKQVEEANQLFTGYKEGWKTDMGMIYIILGPPDVIYNNGFTEEWYYDKQNQLPGINFSFTRIKNLFSPDHYVLVRQEQYKNYWFQAIENWREGFN